MDTSKRSQSLHLLLGRRGEIVESWYNAIAQTSFTGLTAHETRSKLLKLTDQLINLLFSESFERREARAIGSELAGMHYSSPETLSRVQEVLASKFAEYLPDDQASMVQPRLAVLLAEIAAGFLEKTRDTILVEQEEVKAALLRERKRVEEALRESEASLAEAQRVAHLGHWEYHWAQNRLHWSDELYRIFGLSKQEFGGRFEDYFERVHPEDRELLVKVGEQLSRGETVSVEHRLVRPDGEVRIVQHRTHYVFDDNLIPPAGRTENLIGEEPGESQEFLNRMLHMAAEHRGKGPTRVVGTVQDITERKALEQQLEHQALHDPLTDLPNRTLFLDRLEQALARDKRREGKVKVLFVDLDNFKLINDSLGHAVGDTLLVRVAERLNACVRKQDTLARFGGDEFTFLIEGPTGALGNALLVSERIIEELQAPFLLGDQEVFVTASIGISSSTSATLPEVLLRNADIAMYRAKAAIRPSYEVFDPSMHTNALERLEVETELRRAIEREEFSIYYQPVVDTVTGKVACLEALLRWEHPERGLLLPDEFIPLAEDTGLIVPIGKWVMKEVSLQARIWQDECTYDPPLRISTNLSARQLQHPTLVQEITEILQESGADLKGIELEITENAAMQYEDFVLRKLKGLKRLGVSLAIDDFGTGYSSLSHLKRLPIDAIKIDRSFIEGLGKDPKARKITEATISLAKALKLRVIPEGVETAEQLAQLRELGCRLAQGYYICEPLPREEATAFIVNNLQSEPVEVD
jgi:diguanylate cyclase (GGDEF)-like protein/PAS domain S-box-containing protein